MTSHFVTVDVCIGKGSSHEYVNLHATSLQYMYVCCQVMHGHEQARTIILRHVLMYMYVYHRQNNYPILMML